jgi:hypothetical protein
VCYYAINYLLISDFQATWEKRIVKSLNTMCAEVNLPLARQVCLKFKNN